jgi:hypothetical protein
VLQAVNLNLFFNAGAEDERRRYFCFFQGNKQATRIAANSPEKIGLSRKDQHVFFGTGSGFDIVIIPCEYEEHDQGDALRVVEVMIVPNGGDFLFFIQGIQATRRLRT